jgi:bacteriocin-like protein
MFTDKYNDFVSQMVQKGYDKYLKHNHHASPAVSYSELTENALKQVSGGEQCNNCLYISYSKTIGINI